MVLFGEGGDGGSENAGASMITDSMEGLPSFIQRSSVMDSAA